MKQSKMEKSIEKLTLKDADSKIAIKKLEDYTAATKLFEEMINNGLTKNRGYNLLSIEKKSSVEINFFSNHKTNLLENQL